MLRKQPIGLAQWPPVRRRIFQPCVVNMYRPVNVRALFYSSILANLICSKVEVMVCVKMMLPFFFFALPKKSRCDGWDSLIGCPVYSEKDFHFEE